MGLFDLPAPILAAIDGWLAPIFGDLPRLALWAAAGAAVSMGLYRLMAPQAALARLKGEAGAARAALLGYDGDFAGLGPIIARSLSLSARHLVLVLGPALAASLPLVCLLAWVSNTYGHAMPDVGAVVAVQAVPEGSMLAWSPADAVEPAGTGWRLAWPAAGAPVRTFDAGGVTLLEVPPPAPIPVVHKRRWWNALIGNPAGYLPSEAAVEAIRLTLPEPRYLAFGPPWARSWEVPFFAVLVACSLAIKLVFRIH
jgi:hypothetical protein